MLAYYKCTCLLSMWVPHIPTYTRRNVARFLPQVYQKDTSMCPNNLISILVTISILASWFVSVFDCLRVGLSASWLSANWIVGKLVCQRVGLSASWFVGELSSYLQTHPVPRKLTFKCNTVCNFVSVSSFTTHIIFA